MRSCWLGCLAVVACLGGIFPACAQGLQVTPVSIVLQHGQMTTTVLVGNHTADRTTMQVRSFAWTQAGGEDVLTPTADLAVSPPIAEIGPDEQQIFRVVLRHPADRVESSYRLLIDQLPPPASPGLVHVTLRFSIPVFARPEGRCDPDTKWTIVVGRDGATLIGTNHGNGHIRVTSPVLKETAGPALSPVSKHPPYILPGSEQSWAINRGAHLRPGSTLDLAAASDAGPIHAMVVVPGL